MRRFDRTIWFGVVTVCWTLALVLLSLRPDLLSFGGLAWGRRAQLRHLVTMAALAVVTVLFLRRFDREHFGPIRTAVATGLVTGTTTVLIVLGRNVSNQDLTSAGSRIEVIGALVGLVVGLVFTWVPDLSERSLLRGLVPPAGLAATALIVMASVVVGDDAPVAETEICEPGRAVASNGAGYVRPIDAADVALTFDRRGDPSIDTDGALIMTGGSFRSDDAGAEITDAVRRSNQLTVSAWIRISDVEQAGPARIVTISEGLNDQQMNMHLGQEGDRLSFRIRNSCDLFNWVLTPPVLTGPDQVHHVVASYGGGIVRVVVDGREMLTRDVGFGTLANWDPSSPLVIGNEATDNRPFRGEIRGLTIFDRLLDDSEIQAIQEAGW